MGGDEFVWFMVDRGSKSEVIGAAECFRRELEAIKSVDDCEVSISCSQGVAWFPDQAGDLDALIALGDQAMYEAKASGKARLVVVE